VIKGQAQPSAFWFLALPVRDFVQLPGWMA